MRFLLQQISVSGEIAENILPLLLPQPHTTNLIFMQKPSSVNDNLQKHMLHKNNTFVLLQIISTEI